MNKTTPLLVSNFASEMSNTVVIFVLSIILFNETGSESLLAFLWFFYYLSSIISHFLMGPVIDRVNKKIIMLTSEWGRALVFIFITMLSFRDNLTFEFIMVAASLAGFLEPMFYPASVSYVLKLVDKQRFKITNSQLETLSQIASIIGPVIGGLLVFILNETYTLIFIVIILIISGLFVLKLPPNINKSMDRVNTKWSEELITGFNFIRNQKLIIWLSLLIFCVNTAFGTIQPLFLPFVTLELNGSEFDYGLVNSLIAAGMIVGSLLINLKFLKGNTKVIMLGALTSSGVMMLSMGLSEILILFITFVFLDGLFTSLFNINNTYLYQILTPEHLIGRVFTIKGLISILGLLFGTFLGGILSEFLPIRLIFIIMSFVIIIPCAISFFNPEFNRIDHLTDEK